MMGFFDTSNGGMRLFIADNCEILLSILAGTQLLS